MVSMVRHILYLKTGFTVPVCYWYWQRSFTQGIMYHCQGYLQNIPVQADCLKPLCRCDAGSEIFLQYMTGN